MTAPTLYLEATFGQGPAGGPWMTLDDQVRGILDTDKLADDTLGSGFWTNLVTADGVQAVSTRRGRQRLLQAPDAGTLSARIKNTTRRLDPTNTTGPYVSAGASLVKPMRPVRLRAEWGTSTVTLPGTSAADYLSTPHTAAYALTDIFFEWYGSGPWTSTGTYTLAAKWGAAGQRSWRLRVVNSQFEWSWSTDGTAVSTITLTGGTNFYSSTELVGITVMFDANVASPGYGTAIVGNANLETVMATGATTRISNDGDVGTAGTSIFNASSTPITLGQANGADPWPGSVVEFRLYDRAIYQTSLANQNYFVSSSQKGRLVANFDARWVTTGATTVVSHTTGETWTLNGAATVGGAANNYPIWQGYADEWANVWEEKKVGWCDLTATDGFKVLSRVDNNATSPVGAGELTGVRIGRLLDSASWGTGDRDLDTGQTNCQATTLAQNVLTELFLTADTERGNVYVSGDGKFTFRDRTDRYDNQRSKQRAWLLGDNNDGLELPYVDLVMSGDDDLVVNQISIARVGGTAQTTADATSIAQYLTRTFIRDDLIHQTDAESANYASITLAEFKDQDLRFDAVVVNPARTDRLWPFVLGARIGDRVTIRRRPPGGGATIERDCFIEGVAHDIGLGNGNWIATFQLSDASRWGGFVLDDPTLGVLDSDRLAY